MSKIDIPSVIFLITILSLLIFVSFKTGQINPDHDSIYKECLYRRDALSLKKINDEINSKCKNLAEEVMNSKWK